MVPKATVKTPLQQHLLTEEKRILREALSGADWVLLHAAEALGMRFSSLQRALERHPDLRAELTEKGRKRGRPAKNKDENDV